MLTYPKLASLSRARDRLCAVQLEAPMIREVAAEAGVSTGLFIRQFTALFGETPHQMRIRARLQLAKRLLAQGELSVTETCCEVGFSSLGSFSQLFHRRVGQSPSSYRRTVIQVPPEWGPAPACLSLMGAAFSQAVQF